MKKTYELLAMQSAQLPTNRFSGKNVRQDSVKLKNIKKRERRLKKIGLSVLFFAS